MLRYQHIDIIRSIWLGPEPPSNPYEYPIWIDTDDSVPYAYVFQLKKWVPLDEILGRKVIVYKFAPTIKLSKLITNATDYILAFNINDIPIPENLLYYFPNLQENTVIENTLVASNLDTKSEAYIKVVYTPTNTATIEYPIPANNAAFFNLANVKELQIFGKGSNLQLDINVTFDITKSVTPDFSSFF